MTILLSFAVWALASACPAHYPTGFSPSFNCRADRDSLPYQMEKPDVVINLVSPDLQEISGLGTTDTAGVFCAVSDEKGEIFFIDGNGGGAILRRTWFRDKGDFEGVERVGKCIYAVKSDGEIFEITDNQRKNVNARIYKTFLTKADDVEGLGYDVKRNALLLACKGNPDSASLRHVYAFDLTAKQLGRTPVFTVDPIAINALVPYGKEDKHHFFSPSGIAIHPKTGDVYIVSSALKRLAVLDYQTGKLRYAVRINKKLLPQPEGIAFDPNGNMYISSEGKQGEGILLRFNYNPQ